MLNTPTAAAGYVVLTGTVEWDEVAYCSRCPELRVASCGDTVEEALDNLGAALEVLFEDLADLGSLETELKEKGIAVQPAPPPAAAVSVSVPAGKTLRVYVQKLPVPAPAAV